MKKSIILVILLSITACGGGGGGGGGGGSGASSNSSTTPTTFNENWLAPSSASADSYKTSEYNAQWGLGAIHAAEAYSELEANGKNVAGDGVKIAVIDVGVQLSHPEISANYSSVGSHDYIGGDSDPNETSNNHGTHVASIAAGVKDETGMHGVAYDATIMVERALGNCTIAGCDFYYGSIGDSAAAGAKVINMSIGGSAYPGIKNSMLVAAGRDALMVVATGNSNASQPDYPARYAADSGLTGYVLAVGAIGYDGTLASYSNDCGDAKSYCLVAPGGSFDGNDAHAIYAAVPTDSYEYLNGTSMAAPHVSGAAAVIRGAWTFLSAPQVAQILLHSANRSFSGYNENEYGQGILDLEAAVQAQGQNTLGYGTSVVSGAGYDLATTSLISSPIFGDAFATNVAPQLSQAIFYDDFGRDYKANLGDKIGASHANNSFSAANMMFNNIGYKSAAINFGTKSQMHLNLASYKNSDAQNYLGLKYAAIDPAEDPQKRMWGNGFSFTQNSADILPGSKFGFAFNFDEISYQQNQGNYGQGNYGFLSQNSFAANPYQSFMQQVSSPTTNLRKFNQVFFDQSFLNEKMKMRFSYQEARDSSVKQNQVVDAGLSFKALSLSFGNLTEFNNNILNAKSLGAFESTGNVKTSYSKLSLNQKLGENWRFLASISEGVSKINGNQQGIFRDFSNVRSRSFSLGLLWKNFGLNYFEPMRVYSGKVAYDIAVARDDSGNLYRSSGHASLAPNGKERDIEGFYFHDLSQSSQIRFSFLMQRQPGNIKAAPTNFLALVGYKKSW